jgi:U3 small nucleolar RNA-associated protein 14
MTFTASSASQPADGRKKTGVLEVPALAPAAVRMQGAISVEADEAGSDPSNPWLRPPPEVPAAASVKTADKPKQRGRPNISSEALPKKVDLPVLAGGFTLRPGAAENAQEQHDLIERAFPADHLEAEFAAEKEKERELEEPSTAPALPGWGSWAGEGIASKPVSAPPQQKPKPRADDRLQHVVLNEKRDKKAARHRLDAVPHGYGSREHYERALRQPLGKEWNTAQSHRALVLPRISVSAGQVIDPIKFSRKSYELLQAKTKKKQQPRAPLHL